MAWTVGIQVGSVIDAGSHSLQVVDSHPQVVVLLVDGDKVVVIPQGERVEVVPEVFVFIGEGEGPHPNRRLAFEAPRDIKLLRRV